MTTVYGYIDTNGDIISGSGNFNVTRIDLGLWDITFKENTFINTPAVTVSQLSSDGSDTTDHGGSTLDNANLVILNKSRVRIKTGDDSGKPKNRHFTFIAIGN